MNEAWNEYDFSFGWWPYCVAAKRDIDDYLTLKRLIEKRKMPSVSLQEQLQQVDDLTRIARDRPHLFAQRDDLGLLPLHVAISNDLSLEMISILVEAYPESVLARFGSGMTSLRQAKTRETLDYLLDRAMRYLHSTRAWKEVQSFFACHFNMEDVVQRLVDEYGVSFLGREGTFDLPNGDEKRLPLCYAIGHRASLEVLTILVTGYPRSLYSTMSSNGETPLHYACRIGGLDLPTLKLLADSKSVRQRDKKKYLPIHLYCRHSVHTWNVFAVLDLQVIQFLIELYPASLGLVDDDGMLPIHHACLVPRQENLPAIQALVQAYPRGLEIQNELCLTPIFVAIPFATEEYVPVIQYLAEACPQSVSQLNGLGITVLNWYFVGCCRSPNASVVQALFNANPNILGIKDMEGFTPFHRACQESRDLCTMRFMAGKCPEMLESDSEDEIGTPLHTLCKSMNGACRWCRPFRQDRDFPREKCQHHLRAPTLEAVRILAFSEKAVKAKNSAGLTPLHLLCGSGESREVLMILLNQAPSAARARDCNGQIPLHSAIEGYARDAYPGGIKESLYEETIQCLLEIFPLGVQVANNDKGMTPLMLACEFDLSLSIIYQLVKTDPISNRHGWSQVSHKYKANDSAVTGLTCFFSHLGRAFGLVR
jgi:ankyrin repeat protein